MSALPSFSPAAPQDCAPPGAPSRDARTIVSQLRFMRKTAAPRAVFKCYCATLATPPRPQQFGSAATSFQEIVSRGSYSNDWFTANIPYWTRVLNAVGLRTRRIRALEVGSWEGMSSRFILEYLPLAELTCVDTWHGSDEHSDPTVVGHTESRFDANTEAVRARLTKYKGTSHQYFAARDRQQFDLIYIDGSHHCNDVVVDAIRGFERLSVGGIMIFDDYLWRFYPRPLDNPAAAINAFLRLKRGAYRLLEVYWQLILTRTR
jgi:predicted O-methyltransferase YrrM